MRTHTTYPYVVPEAFFAHYSEKLVARVSNLGHEELHVRSCMRELRKHLRSVRYEREQTQDLLTQYVEAQPMAAAE